jgi:mono/diheme cytochrome c family protein
MAQAWIQFQGMCLVCHGAPGRERSAIGKGMLPDPPSLSEEAPEWTPGELFWITKYGLKMAGMPAFGPTHDDQTLWTITSFVNELPNLTPKELQELRK